MGYELIVKDDAGKIIKREYGSKEALQARAIQLRLIYQQMDVEEIRYKVSVKKA